jgi:hypothetical protein
MSLLDGGEGRKAPGLGMGTEPSSRPRLEVGDDSLRPESEMSYRTEDHEVVEEHPQSHGSYGGESAHWRMSNNASFSGYNEAEIPTPRQSQYFRDDEDESGGSQTNYVGQAI